MLAVGSYIITFIVIVTHWNCSHLLDGRQRQLLQTNQGIRTPTPRFHGNKIASLIVTTQIVSIYEHVPASVGANTQTIDRK